MCPSGWQEFIVDHQVVGVHNFDPEVFVEPSVDSHQQHQCAGIKEVEVIVSVPKPPQDIGDKQVHAKGIGLKGPLFGVKDPRVDFMVEELLTP